MAAPSRCDGSEAQHYRSAPAFVETARRKNGIGKNSRRSIFRGAAGRRKLPRAPHGNQDEAMRRGRPATLRKIPAPLPSPDANIGSFGGRRMMSAQRQSGFDEIRIIQFAPSHCYLAYSGRKTVHIPACAGACSS